MTNSENELPDIAVPSDWNIEKDLAYFCDFYPDDSSNPQVMLNLILRHLEELHEVLDRAIRYFLKSPTETGSWLGLSAVAKCKILFALIQTQKKGTNYETRFVRNLDQIAHVDGLVQQLLPRWLLQPHKVWLREYIDLDDWIVTGWMNLDESMGCEHEHYRFYLGGR